MCLVGYAGFLRYNEIANLKMCNLNIFDTYISLNIESSKTDIYIEGVIMLLFLKLIVQLVQFHGF